MITFDGPNKLIQLDTSTTSYTATEIYSRWKDWVRGGQGQYQEAFSIGGGEDVGGGQVSPTFVFLRNDYGWRIARPEATIEVTIRGNLIGADTGLPLFTGPVGSFNPVIGIALSQVTTFDEQQLWSTLLTSFNGDATVGDALALLLKLARNRAITSTASGKLTIYDDDNTTVLLEGDVFQDAAGTTPYNGAGIERRDRLV